MELFTDPFFLCIAAILVLAVLGLPIGLSMIGGSILYLLLNGLDMGIVAEQFLNRMYANYIILAVPLFILAAEFMNIGSLSDKLLVWCNAVVGRFRGGLALVNVLQSIVFAGMSGSAIADAAGTGKLVHSLMTRDGKYPNSFAAALTAASAVKMPISAGANTHSPMPDSAMMPMPMPVQSQANRLAMSFRLAPTACPMRAMAASWMP